MKWRTALAAAVICFSAVGLRADDTTVRAKALYPDSTTAFVASLPTAKKAGEKQPEAWWITRDAAANTTALRVTRLNDEEFAGELFVTGDRGGVFEFRGKVPAGKTPLAILTPTKGSVNKGVKRGSYDAEPQLKALGIRVLILTPGDGGTACVTGIEMDGNVIELAAMEAEKARLLVGPLLTALQDEEKIRIAAREIKAIDYEAEWNGGGGHKPGDEVVVLLRGVRGGGVWGSGPYTFDSSIPTAAVHAGVVANGALGLVKIKYMSGVSEYTTTEKNGVKTNAYGPYSLSYMLEAVKID